MTHSDDFEQLVKSAVKQTPGRGFSVSDFQYRKIRNVNRSYWKPVAVGAIGAVIALGIGSIVFQHEIVPSEAHPGAVNAGQTVASTDYYVSFTPANISPPLGVSGMSFVLQTKNWAPTATFTVIGIVASKSSSVTGYSLYPTDNHTHGELSHEFTSTAVVSHFFSKHGFSVSPKLPSFTIQQDAKADFHLFVQTASPTDPKDIRIVIVGVNMENNVPKILWYRVVSPSK